MNKRDVKKINVGDWVILKHNLGEGTVTAIAWDRDQERGLPTNGRYPMIQFQQAHTNAYLWSTYRIVRIHKPQEV